MDPSQDIGPGGEGEFVLGGQEVEGGLEEAGSAPTGDAGAETGVIPVQAAEADEPVEQGDDRHESPDVFNVLCEKGATEAEMGLPVAETVFNFHATAIEGKSLLGVRERGGKQPGFGMVAFRRRAS